MQRGFLNWIQEQKYGISIEAGEIKLKISVFVSSVILKLISVLRSVPWVPMKFTQGESV